MSTELHLSRRHFLKTSATVGGGLIIGFYLPGPIKHALAQGAAEAPKYPPNAFVRIAPDSTVSIVINKFEMGQGIFTSMSQLLAEELECDWTKVKAVPADVNPVYNHTMFGLMQMTGGSTSLISSYDQYRKIGAAARVMLIQAAAARWRVEPKTCRAENGFVLHNEFGQLPYGDLAEAANAMPLPEDVKLKDPKDFKLIGHSVERLDAREKSTGQAIYGLDVRLPNLARVVVLRPPVFGATLKSFDGAAAKATPGVLDVVRVGNKVAVLAKNTYAARKGRDAIKAEWQTVGKDEVSSAGLMTSFRAQAGHPEFEVTKSPEAVKDVAFDKRALVAEYEFPYLSHAAMEPLNCTVDFDGTKANIYSGHQGPTWDAGVAAQILGLKPTDVKINAVYAGGSFGRRGSKTSDFVAEACEIAKIVKRPIQVVWTREDDMKGGYYRPLTYHRAKISTDRHGRPQAWHHQIVSQSIMRGGLMEAFLQGGPDRTATEGVTESAYLIPKMQVDLTMPNLDIPVLWFRSVGHTHTAYVMETLMDELAHRGRHDELKYRRDLLQGKSRHLAVLDLLKQKSPWGKPAPKGHAYGLAIHQSFGTVVAHVAEVSMVDHQPKVHRVWSAVHCGRLVNPEGARTQVEGGVVFGLSAALYGEIAIDKGSCTTTNFNQYPVVRMKDAPKIEVHFVESTDTPTGLGEPGVPPIAPAVANAVFKLTGQRVRTLPFTKGLKA